MEDHKRVEENNHSEDEKKTTRMDEQSVENNAEDEKTTSAEDEKTARVVHDAQEKNSSRKTSVPAVSLSWCCPGGILRRRP